MDKVLFLQKWCSLSGGVERVNQNLSRAFAAQGVPSEFYIYSIEGEKKQGFDALSKAFAAVHSPQNASLLKRVKHLFSHIRHNHITTVIAATETANLLAFLCGVRYPNLHIIYCRHCAFDVSDQRLSPWLIKALYSLYLISGTVVTVSRALQQQLKNSVMWGKQNIHFIANAVISEDLHRLSGEKLRPLGTPKYFIAVGRLVEQKGFDLLLEAYAKASTVDTNLPDLVIVGEGPDERTLKEQAIRLDIEDGVHFYGYASNPYPIIKGAKALILSSRHEGMPTVIIEALSLNVPVIAFDCPTGPSELVRNGINGKLIPPQDVDGLVDAILNYQDMPQSQLADSVSEFAYPAVVAKYSKLMKSSKHG